MMQLDPWWIVGFTEGEGCFYINIYMKAKGNGVLVRPIFSIAQGDETLLNSIRSSFGIGGVYRCAGRKNKQLYIYLTGSNRQARQIRSFFERYPLQGKKQRSFKIWCRVLDIIDRGEHLTLEGLLKINKLRRDMNSSKGKIKITDDQIIRRWNSLSRHEWSDADTQFVLDSYKTMPFSEIAKKLKRTPSSVRNHVDYITKRKKND